MDIASVDPADVMHMMEPNIMEYIMLRANSCSDATAGDGGDIFESLPKHAAFMRRSSTEEVRTRALAGRAEDCLELGLRCVHITLACTG